MFKQLSTYLCVLIAIVCLGAQTYTYAQTPNSQEIQRLQDAMQDAQKQAREIKPNINQSASQTTRQTIPKWQAFIPQAQAETPCFWIQSIQWKGSDLFDWLTIQAMPILRQCVGINTLKALQDHLGQSLIDAGYITTRVLIPEQQLSGGNLRIDVIPSVIAGHKQTGQSIGKIANILPKQAGQLLNQRDLDQAIENARRLPSQDSLAIDIAPGKNQGESELNIKSPEQPRRWRLNLSVDNTGSRGTGNDYQLGGTYSYDAPLGLYDFLNLNLGSNSNYGAKDKNNFTRGAQWTVPLGYAMFAIGANKSRYKQTVAGFAGPIVYSGTSTGLDAGLTYVVHRDASQKNSFGLKITRKTSNSYLDDTAIAVQAKDITGYELSYNHRNNFGNNTLDLTLGIKGNLTRYTNNAGVIVGQPGWSGHTQIHTGNLTWTTPFTWGENNAQKSRFQTQLKWQNAQTIIPNGDYFSLGGRYSVRGTDGAMSLAAQSGWLLRTDLSWNVPNTNSQLYLAYDMGKVTGPNTANLLGTFLSAFALGYKGNYQGLSFDIAYGLHGAQPNGFVVNKPVIYGQMSYDF